MADEPREPVAVLSPELALKLAQLQLFLRLADRGFYAELFCD